MQFYRILAAAVAPFLLSPPAMAMDPCSAGGAGLESGVHEMTGPSGALRTFRVHVPAGYDFDDPAPAPLVAIFHGWGGDEDEFLGFKRVRDQADARGYILVAPRGLGSGAPDFNFNSWSFRGSTSGLDGNVPPGKICDDSITPDYSYESCNTAGISQNSCSWTQCQADDVAFAVALVEHMKANLCIDDANVFAAGGSNGGMFAWELGQNETSAETFAAIAPLIGLPHRGYLDPPGKDEDMPVLVITGTMDNVVPPGEWEDPGFTTTSNFNDRYYYSGATAITRSWAEAHGCSTASGAVPFDDGIRRTDCRTYCSNDAGWPRVLDCRIQMGHSYSFQWTWPLILDFFDAHSL